MLEYFTYKKVKKHREQQAADKRKEKGKQIAVDEETEGNPEAATTTAPIVSNPVDDDAPAAGRPVLDHEDEQFLEHLTSSDMSLVDNEDGTPPPLPPRVKTPVVDIDSDASSVSSQKEQESQKQKDPEKDNHQPKSRFAFVKALPRTISLRRKPPATHHHKDRLTVPKDPKQGTPATEEDDNARLTRVLDDLDLASRNNRAISLSAESAALAHTFTQILQDLVNGVPTAYGDLTRLLDDSDGVLARNYARLPRSLKKLVAQLPEKLTSTLAPELLAVAAEAQGVEHGSAKKFLAPGNLLDLVTKPGALVGLLRGVLNALKTRFPAFVGTNVLWSIAVFLLLSVLWYCYKRGREERLEREGAVAAEGEGGKGEVIGEAGTDGEPVVRVSGPEVDKGASGDDAVPKL
ncbi:hypothetical protein F4861DRAFT_190764 [Xylaria intraflava]|nr:hypothetical protein F4861DRAFT_190764 [Xylaria intraflava]